MIRREAWYQDMVCKQADKPRALSPSELKRYREKPYETVLEDARQKSDERIGLPVGYAHHVEYLERTLASYSFQLEMLTSQAPAGAPYREPLVRVLEAVNSLMAKLLEVLNFYLERKMRVFESSSTPFYDEVDAVLEALQEIVADVKETTEQYAVGEVIRPHARVLVSLSQEVARRIEEARQAFGAIQVS